MSLVFWAPLIGDLHNQGCSNISLTTVGTIAVDNNGKLGKCYAFPGAQGTNCIRLSLATCDTFPDNHPFSIGGWFYFTSWATPNGCGILGTNHYYTTSTSRNGVTYKGGGFGIHVTNTGSVYGILGTDTANYNTSRYSLSLNTWYHIFTTFDGNTHSLYINGSLINSQANRSYTTNGQLFTIGCGPQGGWTYPADKKINDVRIYDECLSPKEVKEIAQGLILHYKFNSKGVNKNLVSKTYDVNGEIVGTREYINLFSTLSIYETYGLVPYTVSFDLRSEVPHSFNICGNYGSNPKYVFTNTHINVTTEWQHFSYTFTPYLNGDGTGTWAGVSIYGTYDSGAIPHIKNIKFELGEFETPLSPVDISMIYDMSGYSHHHQPSGPFTLSSDTPRYDKSLVFNGTNTYINLGRDLMVKDALTVTTWAYMSSWTSFARIASCTETGGWNFEKNGSNLHFSVGVGVSSNTYMSGAAFPLSQISSGWHMITGTFDGITKCLYIDGQLKSSGTVASKTPIFYNSKNNIFIGAEAAGGTTPTTPYFNGKMSDFRMYGTALSAEDVLELYHTSVSIDNQHNVYSFEFQEHNENIFKSEYLQAEAKNKGNGDGHIVDRNGESAIWTLPNIMYFGSEDERNTHLKDYFIPSTQYLFDLWVDTDEHVNNNGVNYASGIYIIYTDGTSTNATLVKGDLNSPKGFQHVTFITPSNKSVKGICFSYNYSKNTYFRVDSIIIPINNQTSIEHTGVFNSEQFREQIDGAKISKDSLVNGNSFIEK